MIVDSVVPDEDRSCVDPRQVDPINSVADAIGAFVIKGRRAEKLALVTVRLQG